MKRKSMQSMVRKKIASQAALRARAAKARTKKQRPLQLLVTATRQPKDSPARGLKACNTIEEIDALRRTWFRKFKLKALRGVRKRELAEVRSKIDKLLSHPGATFIPTLTNEPICNEAYRTLREAFAAAVGESSNLEFAFVTIIAGEGATSHSNAIIDLAASRKRAQTTLRTMATHYFGIVELSLFNSKGCVGGGQLLQVHEHAIIWGLPGLLNKAKAVASKHSKRLMANVSGAPIIDVRSVAPTSINLARVSAYLFKPPYSCMNWNPGKDGKPGFMNHSEKGDRFARYLRLVQIRSMLGFEETCYAGGDGIAIRRQLFDFVQALAKREAANGNAVIHPDAIPAFWVASMHYIKTGRWTLPVILRR